MTALLPVDHVKIVKLFFKSRPMKIHWIQVPKDIRNSLIKLFYENDLNYLAKSLELQIETITQFQLEKSDMDFITTTVTRGKESGESAQYIHFKIKERVIKLYGLLPNGPLADEIGIPLTTPDGLILKIIRSFFIYSQVAQRVG